MFTDPKGIKFIGTPAWRTRVVRREKEGGEVGKESMVMHHEGSDEEAGIGGSGGGVTASEVVPVSKEMI